MKIKYVFVLPTIVATLVLSGISFAHAQVFTKNLSFGMQGDAQVSQLQELLKARGLYTGPITGNFYFLTLTAVKAFQTQQGISPAAGYFGPLTRAAAEKIADVEIRASDAQAVAETGTSTPSTTAPNTMQLQLDVLLKQVALLQQQLQAQQSSAQAIQNLQAQVQQQTRIIQQLPQIATITPTLPVWDACKNIEGIQSVVSAGMYGDGNGNCLAIPNANTGNVPPPQSTTPVQPQAQTQPTPAPTPTPSPTPAPAPIPLPAPQLKVIISSDKNQLGANGQDAAKITVMVTSADGTPAGDKAVLEISPKSQALTTDANGIATFTVTSGQEGNLLARASVDGQNYSVVINAISTTGNVSGNITHSGDVRMGTASGAVRAPASDQILSFFVANSIDSSISGLKVKSMKLKLTNLDQTWFKNVRITNSPPCTQGRFCSYQTTAGPASYNLESDGILTITPNTPVDVYQGKPIFIIADMLSTPSTAYGTDKPITTYQISVPDNSSIELVGKVNGYDINTINLNLLSSQYTTPVTSGITPVTATINSNTCITSDGKTVACY